MASVRSASATRESATLLLLSLSDPIVQKIMLCTFWAVVMETRNITIEEEMKLIIIPTSSIRLISLRPLVMLSIYTIKIVTKAPAKPKSGSTIVESAEKPQTIAIVTPREAPPEIPSV